MSKIFILLLLFSYTTTVLSADKDDEKVLLRIKQQLGNSSYLSWWVEGFDFCDASANTDTDHSYITCTDTGRVRSLLLRNFDTPNTFPTGYCQLTELQDLIIEPSPGFYGPVPSCITKLPNLMGVAIMGTSFSGPVPNFHKNENIMFINLSRNKLSGTIPASLGTLPKLNSLILSSNYLSGSIPSGLVNRPSFSLELSNNLLTGELPKCFGWADFWLIDLSNNQLTGDASFLFGKNKKAVNIILANNSFEFDLGKVEFSDNIGEFDLSHNKIYGIVPESFATAAALYYPNLSFNRLCGELPRGGNMWRFKPEVFANNLCLCGYPVPPCSGSSPAPIRHALIERDESCPPSLLLYQLLCSHGTLLLNQTVANGKASVATPPVRSLTFPCQVETLLERFRQFYPI